MGIKLIAVDLDDTLLNDNIVISERNKRAVSNAVKQGVTVTVSTGRMYRSALPFARELKLDVPLIVYNGALIKTSFTEETLFHRPVDQAVAKEIFSLAKANNWYIQAYINDKLYVKEINDYAREYAALAKVDLELLPESFYNLAGDSTKIMIIAEPEKLQSIKSELKSEFASKITITISKPTYLEITDTGVSKGSALKMLAEKLGVDRREVMAIGDSGNDIEMLKFAHWSVAMENATLEAKAAAAFETSSNNADGVAEAIEKYVLNPD